MKALLSLTKKIQQGINMLKLFFTTAAQTEQRYRSIIAVSNTGGWEYHSDIGYVWCSPEYISMLGYDAATFPTSIKANLKEVWMDLLHPDDLEKAIKVFQDYLDSGSRGLYENYFRMRHKEGHWVWIWSRGQTLRNPDGALSSLTVGTHIDITEQKNAEAELLRSEARFRSIFENAPYSITINRLEDGALLAANQAFLDNHNLTLENALSRRSDSMSKANDDPREIIRELRENRQVKNKEATIQMEDGSTRNIIYSSVMLDSKDEQVLSMVVDVTDKIEAEAKLRSLFSSMRDIIVVLDAEGFCTEVAPTASNTQYSISEQLLGKKISAVLDPDLTNQIQQTIQDVLTDGIQRTLDYTIEIAGQNLWFSASVSKFTPTSVIWVARDITQRKTDEHEKQLLQSQLLQSQKMESVGRLAGGVAHDFNNMLSVILGYSQMSLTETDSSSRLHSQLLQINSAASKSADLTRQLLTFARKQVAEPRLLDLNQTVAGMLKILQRLVGENIRLKWIPGSDSLRVRMDPSQVDQILANLCVNARDAISDTGEIVIETAAVSFNQDYASLHPYIKAGDYCLIAISDDGCGMSQDTVSHIFEPFFTTKEEGKGTGLGMSTVYGIVKQNNGFINVYSEPGRGTTFRIYLTSEARQETDQQDPTPPEIRGGDETVLIVEDEPAIRQITSIILNEQGYTTLEAADLDDARRLVEENRVDLLISDVIMPEINGKDLSVELLKIRPQMKCLFMSGYTSSFIAEHGVLDEGVDFIAKPFSSESLALKVREVLDKEPF